MPEALIAALDELAAAYDKARGRPRVPRRARPPAARLHRPPVAAHGRARLAEHAGGARILLKREDLNHTGSHKINNVLGQALLTKRMGKTRVIAETGAGQHGVATATACALLGLECVVYMGEVDTERQALNVARMRLLGAEVVPVTTGSRTLKDAINEALRDWVTNVDTHALPARHRRRPAPVPDDGARLPPGHRRWRRASRCSSAPAGCPTPSPRASAAAPTRSASSTPSSTTPTCGWSASSPAATASRPAATPPRSPGARPACCTARSPTCCRTRTGRPIESHSISAGLDYPGVGPEHALAARTSAGPTYRPVTDAEAMEAFALLCRTEGIIPAIESRARRRRRAAAGPRARAGRDHPRQPVRPRRQGRRHRREVVRHDLGRRERRGRERHGHRGGLARRPGHRGTEHRPSGETRVTTDAEGVQR